MGIFDSNKEKKMPSYKIDKYGWTYIAHVDEGKDIKYEVITPEKVDSPRCFHKLYSLSKNGVDSLVNQYVYATHPHQFNDLFDCHEDLIEFDDEEAVRFFCNEYAKEFFPDDKLERAIKEDFKNLSVFVKRNFKELIYGNFGVFSVTSNPYSILMWSYYTNHRGFMIEYDVNKFRFKYHGPFPLNYQENIEPISVKECGVPLAVLLQANLKYKGWEHENEWRLIIQSKDRMVIPSFEKLKKLGGHDRKFKYPIDAIKLVGFGNRFFAPEELNIIDDKILHVTIKDDIELKVQILDFLTANKISTCFAEREGLMKIIYGGMVIEKIGENKYEFNKVKWAEAQKKNGQ